MNHGPSECHHFSLTIPGSDRALFLSAELFLVWAKVTRLVLAGSTPSRTSASRPDLPGLNGLEVARQVQQRAPKTRVVILSMHENEAYVLQALRNGAAGYVLKQSSAATLIQAVTEVSQGRRFLSPSLSDRAVEAYLQKAEPTSFDLYETLTSREREVLQLAAEGHNNPEIAERLFISCRTVETHRANLLRKLNLHSQTDLIRYALRKGILPLED